MYVNHALIFLFFCLTRVKRRRYSEKEGVVCVTYMTSGMVYLLVAWTVWSR